MVKFSFPLLFVFFLNLDLRGQTIEPASTINRNELQTEFESVFLNKLEKVSTTESWLIPGILFRYGLSEALELQVGFSGLYEKLYDLDGSTSSDYTFQKPEIGLAMQLWKEGSLVQEAELMVRIAFPYEQPVVADEFEGIISLNMGNQVAERFYFSCNIGMASHDGEMFKSGIFIANLNYEAGSQTHFFLEDVNDFDWEGNLSNTLIAGGGYNLSDSFILDLSVGKSLSDPSIFAGAILTWGFEF